MHRLGFGLLAWLAALLFAVAGYREDAVFKQLQWGGKQELAEVLGLTPERPHPLPRRLHVQLPGMNGAPTSIMVPLSYPTALHLAKHRPATVAIHYLPDDLKVVRLVDDEPAAARLYAVATGLTLLGTILLLPLVHLRVRPYTVRTPMPTRRVGRPW